jgi:hypothetical protein
MPVCTNNMCVCVCVCEEVGNLALYIEFVRPKNVLQAAEFSDKHFEVV